MLQLRPYQQQMKDGIYSEWRAARRAVMCVAPTGAGKTALMSSIFKDFESRPCTAIAHRQELVSQISVALAKADIYHRIIAPKKVVQFVISQHVKEVGKSFHHESASVATGGVQTLIRRGDDLLQWANKVEMWSQDEAHHVLPNNSWGKAVNMFPRAIGLGVTASPIRCDKKPLGKIHGGVFDAMVIGPSMRDLINDGYLADYRIFAPETSLNFDNIDVSKTTGDFSQNSLKQETHRSTITGDIVEHYLKIAPGKRGITFAVDVEQAKLIAQRFNERGIPADAVSGDTPDNIRQNSIDRFKRGDIKQLVNVDLFGEGFDVPAVEVVSMGRATQSFGLYLQQFGRALRVFEGKTHGILLDHVGNVKRHGLPDRQMNWTFNMDEKRSLTKRIGEIPVTTCQACLFAFEAITKICPYCGHEQEVAARSAPEFVDGDLTELTPEVLAQMRGEVDAILQSNDPAIPLGADAVVVNSVKKRHRVQQETIQALRDKIDFWAGVEIYGKGRSESEAYRVFYHKFGMDTVTAQKQKTADMLKLIEVIDEDMNT